MPRQKLNNYQIHTRVKKDDYDNFMRLYPQCLTRFVANAIHLAVTNRSFFDTVFFTNLLPLGESQIIGD